MKIGDDGKKWNFDEVLVLNNKELAFELCCKCDSLPYCRVEPIYKCEKLQSKVKMLVKERIV